MSETEQIIARVLAGDPDAFEGIVKAHQRSVWATAAYYLHNRSQIAEIVDATFVKAYFALEQFKPGRSFDAWITGIARNEIRMTLRRLAAERAATKHYAERLAAEAALDEFDRDRLDEMRASLEGCLANLTEEQRALIEARYAAEKPVAQIAAELRRSADAVKQNLHRIRGQLRDCLDRKALNHGA